MMKAICWALALAAGAAAGAAMPIAGHQPAEEEAILAVMDAYMLEISANDLAAMDARQTPEGMTYRIVAREDEGWDVVPHPNSYWVAPERADDRTYRERYWSPTLLIRGGMALVWAPYEFQVDGETTHCGVDAFSFVKVDGDWKVANSMWTVEPDACTELRPEDPTMIRPGAAPAGAAFDLARAELVDLSHTYDETTLYWPTSPSAFELEVLANGPTDAGFFYAANALATPEHGGTHLDAPIHFSESGWTADEIPLDRLVRPAVVIDVSDRAAADRDYRLQVADLADWEARHGLIPDAAVVFLRTGWDRFWPDAAAYLGDDTPGDASKLHFPAFGAEAAAFLIDQRGAVGLGVDTASIDYGPSRDFGVHQAAAAADVFALENVANLGLLPATGSWVAALPMKIGGGSGGPVRIVAFVPAANP